MVLCRPSVTCVCVWVCVCEVLRVRRECSCSAICCSGLLTMLSRDAVASAHCATARSWVACWCWIEEWRMKRKERNWSAVSSQFLFVPVFLPWICFVLHCVMCWPQISHSQLALLAVAECKAPQNNIMWCDNLKLNNDTDPDALILSWSVLFSVQLAQTFRA